MSWILISEEKCIVDSINLFSLYLKHLKPELMRRLTRKERIIMEYYWTYGKMFIKDLQDKYPEPKPIIDEFFNSSYAHVVSSFLKDDKITVDELKKIIEIKEKGKL